MKLSNLLLAVVFAGACQASATPSGSFLQIGLPGLSPGDAQPFAQDLSKQLDYTTVAVPLSKALADLSQQAGFRLMVTDALANEIIVLRLKGVTVDEAMKRIASTVGAEWHKADAGFELVRPDDLAAKLHEQGLAARAEGIKNMIDRQLKLSGPDDGFTEEKAAALAAHLNQVRHSTGSDIENYRAQMQIEKALPDNRAIWKVLAMVDPRKIAEMESGQRLVFSNHPTPMQAPIEGDLSDIGVQLQTNHNVLAAALLKTLKPDPNPRAAPMFEAGETVQMKSAPARFVLSVQLMFLSQSYMVQMIGFDAGNKPVYVGNANMDVLADDSDMMAERTRVARANESEPKLPVTPVTQLMLDFMKRSIGGGGGSGMQPATGDLRTALLNPDKKDPLAYTFSEAFLGIAERRNENLVAYPDDSAFLLGMFAGMEGELKPSLVMQAVAGLGPMVPTNVTEKDGWLTVAPADLLEAVQTRASRPALSDFLRAFNETGYSTLESAGKLATTVNGREFPVLDMFLPMMVDQAGADLQQSGDLDMLKLYGSLDEGQLTRLNHQPIRLAELRPEQAALVSRYVYEPSNRFGGGWISGPGESQAQIAADNEPTETVPNGLPNDATLAMLSKDAKVYFVKVGMSSGGSYTSPMTIDSLAWTVHLKDHPEEAPGYSPTIESVSPGSERTIQIFIGISDKNRPQCELKEHRPSAGGPWKLDNLPADVKKELDAALARYDQMTRQPGQADSAAPATPPVQVAPPLRRL